MIISFSRCLVLKTLEMYKGIGTVNDLADHEQNEMNSKIVSRVERYPTQK